MMIRKVQSINNLFEGESGNPNELHEVTYSKFPLVKTEKFEIQPINY